MPRVHLLVTILMATAACGYGLSFSALLLRKRRPGRALLAVSWCFNLAVIVVNAWVSGEPPVGNMVHVLVLLSCCLPPLYGLLAFRERLSWLDAYVAFAAAIPLVGALFMEREAGWRRVPALQSPWFVPHVASYTLSYALATVGFVLTMADLLRRAPHRLQDRERYESASYHVTRLAFPFMTFGLISGAMWAERAWGAYWSWDPKETWALATWTLYLVYFLCRRDKGLRPYASVAQLLAFVALLITFLAVNLLPTLGSILHGYA
jgi:ABC-type transport system involved in cytochrome c biogenesis permease subunit